MGWGRTRSIAAVLGVLLGACGLFEYGAAEQPIVTDAGSGDTGAGCAPGFADCDGEPSNGCETKVTDNPSHCGFCGNACPARANGFPVCLDSACRVGCDFGFDNCDGDDGNGCERSVASDPLNCGACSRDCRSAPCANGLCAPTTVASAPKWPTAIAIGPSHIYFMTVDTDTDARELYRVGPSGGLATLLFDTSLSQIQRMVIDGNRLFYAGGGGLGWCELPGCTSPLPVWVGGSVGDFTLTDPTRFYAVVSYNLDDDALVAFDKLALGADGDAGTVTRVRNVSFAPQALAVDSTTAFVLHPAGYGNSPTVIAHPRDSASGSGVPLLSFNGVVSSGSLGLGGGRLFWTFKQQLESCLPSSCEPTRRAYGKVNRAYAYVLDSQFVYWADEGTAAGAFQDGRVLRCPLGGCVGAPTVLAVGQARPEGIALAPDHVYWTVRGDGTPGQGFVRRVAR